MTKPSNPATYFVTGSKKEEFTFTPGDNLYYVLLRTRTTGNGHVLMSVMLFADDEDHVRSILHDLVSFHLECGKKYQEAEGKPSFRDSRYAYSLLLALDGRGKYQLTITPVKHKGQLFKTGWAGNDTIL